MKLYTKTGKTILGVWYPKNVCFSASDSWGKFLIEKEGFKIFNEARYKKKDIKEGGKK